MERTKDPTSEIRNSFEQELIKRINQALRDGLNANEILHVLNHLANEMRTNGAVDK
jgi:hypothetical protein